MLLSYGVVLRALVVVGRRYNYVLRLIALVLVSVLVFFAFSNVLLLLYYSVSRFDVWGDLYAVYMFSLAFSIFNSCVDFFVYYYVSVEFRDKVREGLFRRALGGVAVFKEGGSAGMGTRFFSFV